MITTTVTVNKKQMNEVRRLFRSWPQAVPKIFKESINRTAAKTKTATVSRVAQLSPGIKKKDIRKSVKLYRATLKVLSALIKIKGRGIPISKLGMKTGRAQKTYFEASAKQSAWLFYNVFRPKYGDAAVFKRHYRISRKSYPNITYKVMGRTEKPKEPGVFVQTVRNTWSGGGGGHRGVFVRRSGYGGGALRELFGPSIAEMFSEHIGEINKIKDDAGKGLKQNIDSRIKRYLEKASKIKTQRVA